MAGRRPPQELVLFIDRIQCDGYGTCAELFPEMIRLDEWGYPIVDRGVIPDDHLEHAKRAVDGCPVLALRLADPARVTIGAPPPRRSPGTTKAAIAGRAAREAREARTRR